MNGHKHFGRRACARPSRSRRAPVPVSPRGRVGREPAFAAQSWLLIPQPAPHIAARPGFRVRARRPGMQAGALCCWRGRTEATPPGQSGGGGSLGRAVAAVCNHRAESRRSRWPQPPGGQRSRIQPPVRVGSTRNRPARKPVAGSLGPGRCILVCVRTHKPRVDELKRGKPRSALPASPPWAGAPRAG